MLMKFIKYIHTKTTNVEVYNIQPIFKSEQKNETILDKITNLIWARNASIIQPTFWEHACREAEKISLYGETGWRIPSKYEMEALAFRCNKNEYALKYGYNARKYFQDIGFYNVNYGLYWTSTESDSFFSYAFNMDSGDFGVWPKQSAYRAQIFLVKSQTT